ncbi:hypothetical protein QR680_004571 [Steinernema hermaphroditum]|uniref:RBR-type E3 ubiquitin transferase n=1 Tax=Steinernema hermaphroditum TaxID=289476 RepID=A0AA39LTX4_9BILA|nr:hypothetical protein QR680_004571 [Steinernema hermaphroditum]
MAWYNNVNVLALEVPGSKAGAVVELGPGGEALGIRSNSDQHRLPHMEGFRDASCVMRFKREVTAIGLGGIKLKDHGFMIRNLETLADLQRMFPGCRVSIDGYHAEGENGKGYRKRTYDSQRRFRCHIYGLPADMTEEKFEEYVRARIAEHAPRRFEPEEIRMFGTVVPSDVKKMTRERAMMQLFRTIAKHKLDVQLRSFEGERSLEELTLHLSGTYEHLLILTENMGLIGRECEDPYVAPICEYRRFIPIFKNDGRFLMECFDWDASLVDGMTLALSDDGTRIVLGHSSEEVLGSSYRSYVDAVKRHLEHKPADVNGKECGLCGNSYGLMTLPCEHIICRECADVFMAHGIRRRRFPLCCGECDEVLPLDTILRFVMYSPETLKKLARQSYERHLESMVVGVEMIRCITPDCMGYFRSFEPHYQICPECENHVCVRCSFPAHGDMSCDVFRMRRQNYIEVQTWFEEDKDNRKYCPQCCIGIEKEGGCMHVQCEVCKTHFCWVCMGVLPSAPEVHEHIADRHIGVLFAQ